jgi:hypothetical protein
MAFGGYGAPTIRYARIYGTDALMAGFEGALLLDHRFAIGLFGRGVASDVQGPDSSTGDRSRLNVGYGGMALHYNFVGNDPIYLSVGALIGAGAISFCKYLDHRWEIECDKDTLDPSVFFVAEPEVKVHVNLTRWMRVGAGVSYRLTAGAASRGVGDDDLRGPSAGLELGFGWL